MPLFVSGIVSVEGYHAGAIRTLLYLARNEQTPYNTTVADTVQAISNLRASLGGGEDQGIVVEGSNPEEAIIVPSDDNGLTFARTPDQVRPHALEILLFSCR